jgi:hypothetical protein
MSELVSMAPTSGGQQHWVAMLAPPAWRHVLSYITGEPFPAKSEPANDDEAGLQYVDGNRSWHPERTLLAL